MSDTPLEVGRPCLVRVSGLSCSLRTGRFMEDRFLWGSAGGGEERGSGEGGKGGRRGRRGGLYLTLNTFQPSPVYKDQLTIY